MAYGFSSKELIYLTVPYFDKICDNTRLIDHSSENWPFNMYADTQTTINTQTENSLSTIRSVIQTDLKQVDNYIITQLESNIPMVGEVVEYVLSCGGKRIRPMVLLLSANALNTQAKQHIALAAVIELIHTATLLHDDVVDDSTMRRNHRTANVIWGNDASVLIGDFLYSRAFQIVVNLNRQDILSIFAEATHFIAEGEIMQMINSREPDTTEHHYFDIIHRKTGRLFEIAAQLGAMLACQDTKLIEKLRLYGLHLGLAYQLIDDALDYCTSTDQTGKNVGQDIAEGKMTLPLIYAMQHANSKQQSMIQEAIKTGSLQDITNIMELVESSGAIHYTARTAKQHAITAKSQLSALPASPFAEALALLCDFVVNRTF